MSLLVSIFEKNLRRATRLQRLAPEAWQETLVSISVKEGLKAWSPIVWKGGARLSENFVSAAFATLDVDGGLSSAEALSRLSGFDAVAIATKSHMKPREGVLAGGSSPTSLERYRLVVRLDRIVTSRAQYRAVQEDLFKRLGSKADPSCLDAARVYFPGRSEVLFSQDGRGYPVGSRGRPWLTKKEARLKDNLTKAPVDALLAARGVAIPIIETFSLRPLGPADLPATVGSGVLFPAAQPPAHLEVFEAKFLEPRRVGYIRVAGLSTPPLPGAVKTVSKASGAVFWIPYSFASSVSKDALSACLDSFVQALSAAHPDARVSGWRDSCLFNPREVETLNFSRGRVKSYDLADVVRLGIPSTTSKRGRAPRKSFAALASAAGLDPIIKNPPTLLVRAVRAKDKTELLKALLTVGRLVRRVSDRPSPGAVSVSFGAVVASPSLLLRGMRARGVRSTKVACHRFFAALLREGVFDTLAPTRQGVPVYTLSAAGRKIVVEHLEKIGLKVSVELPAGVEKKPGTVIETLGRPVAGAFNAYVFEAASHFSSLQEMREFFSRHFEGFMTAKPERWTQLESAYRRREKRRGLAQRSSWSRLVSRPAQPKTDENLRRAPSDENERAPLL